MSDDRLHIEIIYVDAVLNILEADGLRKAVSKGRRVGFTHSASYWLIEQMMDEDKPVKVLWVDTVQGNLPRYIERYWMPLLKQLPNQVWNWEKSAHMISIGNSLCDFRSAERPESIEGFGYDIVFLNEAGIILKNSYLWDNAIAPMLLDNPEAVCIAAGVPKGKNKFFELHNSSSWDSYNLTTFDNKFLDPKSIDELIEELPEGAVRQEIYGEFLDESDNALFPYDLLHGATKRCGSQDGVRVWGLDVARHGTDSSVLCKRHYKDVAPLIKKSIPDTMELASWVNLEFNDTPPSERPARIFVDVIGIGWGVYDRLKQYGLPVTPADVGQKSHMQKTLNKRAEMYRSLLAALKEGLGLPDDKNLVRQLAATSYEFNDRGIFKLTSKDGMKKVIGQSPDEADAVALTYYEPVHEVLDNVYQDIPEMVAGY